MASDYASDNVKRFKMQRLEKRPIGREARETGYKETGGDWRM